jgi:uncharacterized protein involved in exopolysaccharide biosynthesis
MKKLIACLMMMLIASSWTVSQSTSVSNDDLAKALIENKFELAKMIEDYYKQDATIKDLEGKLLEIQREQVQANALTQAMQATIDQLKERGEVMKELILASMETNKKQVQEFTKALNEEKRRGNKKMLWGIVGGVIFGLILGVVAK